MLKYILNQNKTLTAKRMSLQNAGSAGYRALGARVSTLPQNEHRFDGLVCVAVDRRGVRGIGLSRCVGHQSRMVQLFTTPVRLGS